MLHTQGQQSSSGTGHNSEQVPYMHYSESSRSRSRLWTYLVSIPTMLPTIWISVKKHSQIAIKINTPANNLEQIKVIKLTAEKDQFLTQREKFELQKHCSLKTLSRNKISLRTLLNNSRNHKFVRSVKHRKKLQRVFQSLVPAITRRSTEHLEGFIRIF